MKNINLVELECWLQNIPGKVADEAVKISKDYPEMTIREVIAKAKEVMKC